MPLGHLVEDFITSSANEIAIHQFDEAAATFQSVAHGGGDNCCFRDRRIEQALIGQDIGQSAIDTEGPAPFAAFLAIGDQALVMHHVMQHRLEQRIAQGDCPHGRELLAVRTNSAA